MSDVSQGPGWWQASDGKWYPPEQAPGAQPAAAPPAFDTPPAYGAPTAPPAYGAPAGMAAGPTGLASWGQRVVAYLIDAGILLAAWIALFIVALILGAISDALAAIVFLIGYLALACAGLYFGWLNGEAGGSPGKRLTGLKVVGEQTGQVIGGGSGVVRQLAHFFDSLLCGLGYFLPLFDDKRQTISDKIMKTVVLADQPKMAFGPELFKK